MDMNRRNVLIGLGTAAAGSSIAFGSGAFTQVDANRDVTIEIDADDGAIVQLTDESDTDLVRLEDDVFEIDTSNITDGDSGFNTDSVIQIGSVNEGGDEPVVDDPAFTIDNNLDDDGAEFNLEIDFELDGGDTSSEDVTLFLDENSTDDTTDDITEILTGDGTSDGPANFGFDNGDDFQEIDLDAAIEIDLSDTTDIDDFGTADGELSLTVTSQDNG